MVAYASKGGTTKQASEIIAEILREKYKLEVDLIDLRKALRTFRTTSVLLSELE